MQRVYAQSELPSELMCEDFLVRLHARVAILSSTEFNLLMSVYVNGPVGMVYLMWGMLYLIRGTDSFQHSEFKSWSTCSACHLFLHYCRHFAHVIHMHGYVLVQRGGLSKVYVCLTGPHPRYFLGCYLDYGSASNFLVRHEAANRCYVLLRVVQARFQSRPMEERCNFRSLEPKAFVRTR